MTVDAPLLLALSPVVALAVLAGAWFARHRRIRLAGAWSAALARAAQLRGRWTPPLLALAALLAAVGVSGPRGGRTDVTGRTRALSLVVAMDISRSMLAEDAVPSRLQRSVREARRLVDDLSGDRLGLIAFAGRSYILVPLTVDGGAVRLYLDAIDPELASQGGTSLGSVLRQGGELLGSSADGADRVLVVFTDGETHDSLAETLAQARALNRIGVKLVLVGEGGTEPARIPIRDSVGTLVEYKLDDQGAVVRTERRDDILRAVSDAAEGTLVGADLADQAGAVRELVSTFRRSESAETRAADLVPRAWIAALAAALVLLAVTLLHRGAALVCLGCLFAHGAEAQRPDAGTRALAAGAPGRAAALYLRAAGRGAAHDTAFYNAGTAAIQAGRFDVARGALEQAAKSLDPELRYRALYNLGLISLRTAASDSAHREALLTEAVDRLRQALLLEPGSPRAKWNLELAERQRPPPTGGGGGGGGGKGGGGAAPREPPPPEPPRSGLDRGQAEQILNSMERQERATRVDQQKRLQPAASGVKDW